MAKFCMTCMAAGQKRSQCDCATKSSVGGAEGAADILQLFIFVLRQLFIFIWQQMKRNGCDANAGKTLRGAASIKNG